MGAEWPCNACGQMIDGKHSSEHTCDPEDIANLLRAESEDAAADLQWQVDSLRSVVAILAERALKEHEAAGYRQTHTTSHDDIQILRSFIEEQK